MREFNDILPFFVTVGLVLPIYHSINNMIESTASYIGETGHLETWGTLKQACLTQKLFCDLCAIGSMIPKLINFHFPSYR